jgi:hypothetical protein
MASRRSLLRAASSGPSSGTVISTPETVLTRGSSEGRRRRHHALRALSRQRLTVILYSQVYAELSPPERVPVAIGLDEDLLRHVLCQMAVLQVIVRQMEDLGAVFLHQLLQRRLAVSGAPGILRL